MDYVRRYYGVPARRGGRVRLGAGFAKAGYEGTITRATHYIWVRLDGARHATPFHPTWELEYLDAASTPAQEKEGGA
jgi:hypothetical protein